MLKDKKDLTSNQLYQLSEQFRMSSLGYMALRSKIKPDDLGKEAETSKDVIDWCGQSNKKSRREISAEEGIVPRHKDLAAREAGIKWF